MKGCQNPTVECPTCGRVLTSNLIERHLWSHDPVRQEGNRQRKNARQSAYLQTPEGRVAAIRSRHSQKGQVAHLRRVKKWRRTETGRVAVSAHTSVYVAVREGRLVRQPCEVCAAVEVYAHHPRGYQGAHRLDVQWLCLRHHMEVHGRVSRSA